MPVRFDKWLLAVNTTKTASMVFRSRSMPAQSLKISVGLSVIEQVRSHRHLGVFFNETLTWTDHINHVLIKASP